MTQARADTPAYFSARSTREFELIAYDRGKITAAVEAGRGNLYCAECEDGRVKDTFFLPAEEREGAGEREFVFEPLPKRGEAFAAVASAKAARGEFADVFEPFYMRKSQAERTKDEI